MKGARIVANSEWNGQAPATWEGYADSNAHRTIRRIYRLRQLFHTVMASTWDWH